MKIQFVRNHILAKNIGIIDGQSGTGKSLIGPIISSLNNCEHWLHDHIIEEIIILLKFKKISLDAARAIAGIQVDLDLYNLFIGRDVNFRNYDTSSVIYGGQDKIYSKRLKLKDGDQISKKIRSKNPFLLINTHHLLMSANFIQKVFFNRNLIFISISRDPITIINNFYKNNWEEKIFNNPRDFSLTLSKNQKDLNAWFLNKYEDKKMSFIEKYANFVIDYQKFQARFNHKNHILVNFEEFIKNPSKYIKIFEKKFGKKTKITNQLLAKFELPRNNLHQNTERDFEKVFDFIKDTNTKNKIYNASKDYAYYYN